MSNSPLEQIEDLVPVQLHSYFVRQRNAMLVRGDFSPLFTDYYLHLASNEIRYGVEQDVLLKDGLAALGLHLASRPRNEAIAWTLNWQDPLQNVFVTGSNRLGNLVGRVFTEDVRAREKNLLIAQVTVSGEEPRQSIIEADQLDFFEIADAYYRESEQRPGRFFRFEGDECALVAAQPDCDLEWFSALDTETLLSLADHEELSLLETREYRFMCGCGLDRILPILASLSEEARSEAFADSGVLIASCPRCGARYTVTEEMLKDA